MSDIVRGGRLNLGAVFTGAGRVLGRRGGRLVLVMLAFYVAPAMLVLLFIPRAAFTPLPMGERVVASLGALVLALLSAFASVFATRVALDGATRPAGLGEQVSASVRAWAVLIPLTILLSASNLMLPFLAPFRPGISLIQAFPVLVGLIGAVFWGLATPVAVAEGRGLFATIARSFHLLGPGRWLFALFYLGLIIVTQILSALSFAVVAAAGSAAGAAQMLRVWPLVAILPSAAITPVWRTFTAAYYVELCRLRDGVAPGEVASVFD